MAWLNWRAPFLSGSMEARSIIRDILMDIDPGLIGFIEGILLLIKSDEEFARKLET